jgi:hypothetical protein
MRPRELWPWLGAGFLTVGTVFAAVAIAYYTKETRYSLSTGPYMITAYVLFVLAFACFFAAIAGWRPWLLWLRFPNITVRVDAVDNSPASIQPPLFPPMPARFLILKVLITSVEADRNVSIRAAYLLRRAKPGSGWYEHLFSSPIWSVSYPRPVDILKFPINLPPQYSEGGELVFELDFRETETDPEAGLGRIEIHDAVSGKMACFPAVVGVYRRHHGLRPTTYAERIGPQPAPPWYSVMGPSDQDSDVMSPSASRTH